MIPNLTVIIAAYVIVRLVVMGMKQFPKEVNDFPLTRVLIGLGCLVSIALVAACAISTLYTGFQVLQ